MSSRVQRRRALLAGALALSCLIPDCRQKRHAGGDVPSGSVSASATPNPSAAPSSIESAIPPANDVAETAPKPANNGPAHRIGEKVSARDYRMTLIAVKECKSRQYYHPRRGNVWLGVQVSLQSTSDNELRVSPFYATLHDSRQHTYTPTFGGCHPALSSARMTKGDKIRGWITFELPRSATGIRLVYDPFVVGGPHQPLDFLVVR